MNEKSKSVTSGDLRVKKDPVPVIRMATVQNDQKESEIRDEFAAIFNADSKKNTTATGAAIHTYNGVKIIKDMISPNPMSRWNISSKKRTRREKAVETSYLAKGHASRFGHIELPANVIDVALARDAFTDDCKDMLTDQRSMQGRSPAFLHEQPSMSVSFKDQYAAQMSRITQSPTSNSNITQAIP